MMKKILNIFTWYEWIFVICSLITLLGLGIYNSIENFKYSIILELTSVILGLLSCVLNGKRKKYAFFFYSAYVILYGSVSFIEKQYGEGVLNLCFNLPMYLFTLYKFYIRDREKDNNENFKVGTLKLWMIIGSIIFVPCVTGLYGYILSLLDSKLPYINALATSFALIAVFFTTKGILWQWLMWTCYSSTLTAIWTLNYIEGSTSGLLYIVLNCIYIVVNFYCLFTWMVIKKKQDKESKEISQEEVK